MKINSPGGGYLPAAFTNLSPITVFGRDFKRLKLQAARKAFPGLPKNPAIPGPDTNACASNAGGMRTSSRTRLQQARHAASITGVRHYRDQRHGIRTACRGAG
tara:strand:+ start:1113 stop:1421 length:309 start_codon:yes stop_codon:yes gene_type:complete